MSIDRLLKDTVLRQRGGHELAQRLKEENRKALELAGRYYADFLYRRDELGSIKDKKVELLGTGASAIVLQLDGNAVKFVDNHEHERDLLLQMDRAHEGKQQNVVRYDYGDNVSARQTGIPLTQIFGVTLEWLLNNRTLHEQHVFMIGRDILNGLHELVEAGIYQHRDIRPGNILVESDVSLIDDGAGRKKVKEVPKRAVIIDLGIATTKQNDSPKDNRRFGGPNDLVSLGQIVYKMSTNNHLFAESKSMERTIYANKIKDERDRIYATPGELDKYREKVKSTIENIDIVEIVDLCLISDGKIEDYDKLKEMFKEGFDRTLR